MPVKAVVIASIPTCTPGGTITAPATSSLPCASCALTTDPTINWESKGRRNVGAAAAPSTPHVQDAPTFATDAALEPTIAESPAGPEELPVVKTTGTPATCEAPHPRIMAPVAVIVTVEHQMISNSTRFLPDPAGFWITNPV